MKATLLIATTLAALLAGCTKNPAEAKVRHDSYPSASEALTELGDWASLRREEFETTVQQKLDQADRRIEALRADIRRASNNAAADTRDLADRLAARRRTLGDKLADYRRATEANVRQIGSEIADGWRDLRRDIEDGFAKLK